MTYCVLSPQVLATSIDAAESEHTLCVINAHAVATLIANTADPNDPNQCCALGGGFCSSGIQIGNVGDLIGAVLRAGADAANVANAG